MINKRKKRTVLKPRSPTRSRDPAQPSSSRARRRAAQIPGVMVAGKTGTTENYGDAWFVGWTKEYTVAVWVGYPDEFKPMETEFQGEPVAGGTFPAGIWKTFMQALLKIHPLPKKDGGDGTGKLEPTPTPGAGTGTARQSTTARRRRPAPPAPAEPGGTRHGADAAPQETTPPTTDARRPHAAGTDADRRPTDGTAPRRARQRRAAGGATDALARRSARDCAARSPAARAARRPGAERAEAPRQLRGLRDPDPRPRRRRGAAPAGDRGSMRIGPSTQRRAVVPEPDPSAWVSLPGPLQSPRRAGAAPRAHHSRCPSSGSKRADQHRRAHALGLADRVQQRVDAVGAVDVGASPAARTAPAVRGVTPDVRVARRLASSGRPRSRRSRPRVSP